MFRLVRWIFFMAGQATILLGAEPPKIVAKATPSTVEVGGIVEFDATGTNDGVGRGLTYQWDFDSDGIYDASGPNQTLVPWVATRPGVTESTLVVTDADGGRSTNRIPLIVSVQRRARHILSQPFSYGASPSEIPWAGPSEFSAGQGKVFVGGSEPDWNIYVFDLESGHATARWQMGQFISGFRLIDGDSKLAVWMERPVTGRSSLALLDLETGDTLTEWMAGESIVDAVRLSDGLIALHTVGPSGRGQLAIHELATGKAKDFANRPVDGLVAVDGSDRVYLFEERPDSLVISRNHVNSREGRFVQEKELILPPAVGSRQFRPSNRLFPRGNLLFTSSGELVRLNDRIEADLEWIKGALPVGGGNLAALSPSYPLGLWVRHNIVTPYRIEPLALLEDVSLMAGNSIVNAFIRGDDVFAVTAGRLLQQWPNSLSGFSTNRAPTVRIRLPSSAARVDEPVRFEALVEDPNGEHPDSMIYRWELGDGSVAEGKGLRAPTHVYQLAGERSVRVRVLDRWGGAAEAQTSLTLHLEPNRGEPATTGTPYLLRDLSGPFALHPTEPRLFAIERRSKHSALVEMNLRTGHREWEWRLPGELSLLVFSPDSKRLYCGTSQPSSLNGDHQIFSELDLASREFRRRLMVPLRYISSFLPTDDGFALAFGNRHPDNQFQCLALQIGDSRVTHQIDLASLGRTFIPSASLHPDQRRAYLLDPLSVTAELWRFDLDSSTGAVQSRLLGSMDRSAFGVALPDLRVVSDGSHLAFNNGLFVRIAVGPDRETSMEVVPGKIAPWSEIANLPGSLFVTRPNSTSLTFHSAAAPTIELGQLNLLPTDGLIGGTGDTVWLWRPHRLYLELVGIPFPSLDASRNKPPVVRIATPGPESRVRSTLQGIEHRFVAMDPDGAVTNLSWSIPGILTNSVAWDFATTSIRIQLSGRYELEVVATDNRGAKSLAARMNFIVTDPPVVQLTSVTAPDGSDAPARLALDAEASDPDGAIREVRFFRQDGLREILLGTTTTSPYRLEIPNAASGGRFVAKAIDDHGVVAVSKPRSVDVIGVPGDDSRRPIRLNSNSGTTTGMLEHATRQSNEPIRSRDTDFFDSGSLWWDWVAPTDGVLVVDTDGSRVDTALSIHSVRPGNPHIQLSRITGADDTAGIAPAVRVRTNVRANERYAIGVSEVSTLDSIARISATGFPRTGRSEFVLNHRFTPVLPPSGPAPTNDGIRNAILLSAPSFAVTGSNVGATREPREALHGGIADTRSVWWVWRPKISGLATLSTAGSDFDTVLAVYRGPDLIPAAPQALVEIIANDDDPAGRQTSAVAFQVATNRTYYIAVAGALGLAGQIHFFGNITPLPLGELAHVDIGVPRLLEGTSGMESFLFAMAPGELVTPTQNGNFWYRWTAPSHGALNLHMHEWFIVDLLEVRPGNPGSTIDRFSPTFATGSQKRVFSGSPHAKKPLNPHFSPSKTSVV